MELLKFLSLAVAVLPVVYGAPTSTMNELHPEILAAMKRDLGLDAEAATARVTREINAADVIEQLKTTAGEHFAGGWVADDGKVINVAVTDKDLADKVEAAGAKPVVVANSLNKLEEAKKALDQLAQGPQTLSEGGSGVAAWYVDIEANKVVIEALADSTEEAKKMASEIGLDEADFEVRTVETMPTTFATIQGGDRYRTGPYSCSIGFSVNGGFVTAGHCGGVGTRTSTPGGEFLGNVAGSVFPGSADMGWIRLQGSHRVTGYINGYGSGRLPVSGSTVAPIGSSICRSGATTGVHCGRVRQFGVTVNYIEGRVTGLTGTTACAERGDSGGSFYAGSQAQGVTSGGSGNCRTGGVTYFQPVNEILSTYRLTLVRA